MFDGKHSKNSKSPKHKILLAEDDSSVRRFIEIILQRSGYEVLVANDGLSAMKTALETKVDAVVTDAMMPNLTGFDLCRILRQTSAYQNIPLIILSGFEKETESIHADAYLRKGDKLKEELLATLSNLLMQTVLS